MGNSLGLGRLLKSVSVIVKVGSVCEKNDIFSYFSVIAKFQVDVFTAPFQAKCQTQMNKSLPSHRKRILDDYYNNLTQS